MPVEGKKYWKLVAIIVDHLKSLIFQLKFLIENRRKEIIYDVS